VITGEPVSRDRRALTLGAGLILILLLAFRGVPAWLAWRADSVASAAELSAELRRARTAVRDVRSALDTTQARVARFSAAGPSFLVARTPAEAPEVLAELVREAARLSSVEVQSLESRVDTAGGPALRHVSATVQGTGDVWGVAALLYRLEGHEALLAVREVSIHPQSVDTPPDGVESLRVRMRIEGLAAVQPERKSE
jgi:hypothetical protein